jgi:IS5 family transposase
VVGKVSHIHVKKHKGKPMSERTARANARKSAIRAKVEHPFAMLMGPLRLFIRTIGLKRAEAAITFAAMAYNMKRWVWLNGRTTSA